MPVSKVSEENHRQFEDWGVKPDGDFFPVSTGPEMLHILVAGGAGKHSRVMGFPLRQSARPVRECQ